MHRTTSSMLNRYLQMVTYGSTSETSTEFRKYTRDLYSRLEEETGQSTGSCAQLTDCLLLNDITSLTCS